MGGGHENVRFEACFPSSGAILRVGRASEPELTLTRVNHVKLLRYSVGRSLGMGSQAILARLHHVRRS